MELPGFAIRAFKINEKGLHFIPLPKPSAGLLRKLYGIFLEANFMPVGDNRFKRRKERISLVKGGALITNFEPLFILKELSDIKWEEYRENLGLEPSWNNSYFAKVEEGIRLYPRVNLSARGFYKLLAKGFVPLMYDEIYVALKLALGSQRIRAISYKTYRAEEAKFLRRVANVALYRVEFSSKSFRDCINEIWEDVITGKPAFLPEPGTYIVSMELMEIDLKSVFSGLGNWCLSDRNLAFPPWQDPSLDLSLSVP